MRVASTDKLLTNAFSSSLFVSSIFCSTVLRFSVSAPFFCIYCITRNHLHSYCVCTYAHMITVHRTFHHAMQISSFTPARQLLSTQCYFNMSSLPLYRSPLCILFSSLLHLQWFNSLHGALFYPHGFYSLSLFLLLYSSWHFSSVLLRASPSTRLTLCRCNLLHQPFTDGYFSLLLVIYYSGLFFSLLSSSLSHLCPLHCDHFTSPSSSLVTSAVFTVISSSYIYILKIIRESTRTIPSMMCSAVNSLTLNKHITPPVRR